jgi:hypothetical protein
VVKKVLRNQFEKKIHRQLKRAKKIFKYEGEHIPYVLARHYIPDFIIYTKSGKIYLECKGYLRPEHKCKMVAVKRQHPNLDIRMLFYAFNKKYITWAEKNNIRYAIGTIPKEWLDE